MKYVLTNTRFMNSVSMESSKRYEVVTADLPESAGNAAILKAKLLNGELKFSPKRKKSKVWESFGLIEDSNGQEIPNVVGCRKCYSIYKFGNSTSNLVRHKCYLLGNARNNDKDEIQVDFETKRKCTKAMAEWSVLNCRPFNMSDDDGLKKIAKLFISVGAVFGKNVNVEAILPQPTTITNNINRIYEFHFNKIKSEISKIKANSYGLTCDVWTDNYIHSSFLSVTIHYIFEGELVRRLLAIKSMKGDICTGPNIRKKFLKVLDKFGCELEEDDPLIVTQRGANMISAFSNSNNIYCIDHLINRTIEKTVNSVPQLDNLITYCNKLVKYFKKTDINGDLEASLRSSCPTRWITVSYLLKSIEENWQEIANILKEKNGHQRIENINLNELSSITKLLEYFEDAAKMLEADSYPTLHLVIPYVHRLKKVCTAKSEDLEIVKTTKAQLLELLQNLVYENLTIYHKVALFLFPPTNKLIQFAESEKEEILTACQQITVALSKNSFESNQNSLKQETGNNEIFEDFVQVHAGPDSLDKLVRSEIDAYRTINIAIANSFDVIQWWSGHESQFPNLYRTSCKMLATPASSASSDKALSAARQLISEDRNNILNDLDLVNKIIFLHSNIKEIDVNILELCPA